MVDDHHAVLFGGWVPGHGKTNDVYILDLERMVSVLGCAYFVALTTCLSCSEGVPLKDSIIWSNVP